MADFGRIDQRWKHAIKSGFVSNSPSVNAIGVNREVNVMYNNLHALVAVCIRFGVSFNTGNIKRFYGGILDNVIPCAVWVIRWFCVTKPFIKAPAIL